MKTQQVYDKWDMARIISMPATETITTIDFSKVSPRIHSGVVKGLKNYPSPSGLGYSSKAGALLYAVTKHFEIPEHHISSHSVHINGLEDESLWQELFDVCMSDAMAHRMETGYDWNVKNLLNIQQRYRKGDTFRYNSYGRGGVDELLIETGLTMRLQDYITRTVGPKIEKALDVVQYGGCITFKLTKY